MIYFLADAHLGSRLNKDPLSHELKLVRWLDMVKKDATCIYLLGDIFDFWFEYRTVVPKGFVRLLGKLAEITDAGIEVHFFIGNHDLWTFGYLEQEVGLRVHREPLIVEHHGNWFFMTHGDDFVDSGKSFRILRSIFHSKIAQQLFLLVPPYLGQHFGYNWSKRNRSRLFSNRKNCFSKPKIQEELPYLSFAENYQSNPPIDFFVFGHRHMAVNRTLSNGSNLTILGDFIKIFSYGVFDGERMELRRFLEQGTKNKE